MYFSTFSMDFFLLGGKRRKWGGRGEETDLLLWLYGRTIYGGRGRLSDNGCCDFAEGKGKRIANETKFFLDLYYAKWYSKQCMKRKYIAEVGSFLAYFSIEG